MSTLTADPAAGRAKARRALEVLEPLGPSRTLARCYSTLSSQDVLQACFESAAPWSRRALELARQVGAEDVAAHALGYRGLAKVSMGDPSGVDDLQRAVEIADRLDHGDHLTVAAHHLAVVLIRSGRVREARPYLEIAERAAREHASTPPGSASRASSATC